jgi:DnaJ-class molecular chaperone
MKHVIKQTRIQIEKTCDGCGGSGKHSFTDLEGRMQAFTCSDCEGEGYQKHYVTLKEFVKIVVENL